MGGWERRLSAAVGSHYAKVRWDSQLEPGSRSDSSKVRTHLAEMESAAVVNRKGVEDDDGFTKCQCPLDGLVSTPPRTWRGQIARCGKGSVKPAPCSSCARAPTGGAVRQLAADV